MQLVGGSKLTFSAVCLRADHQPVVKLWASRSVAHKLSVASANACTLSLPALCCHQGSLPARKL